MAQISTNKELFDKILTIELENAQDIAVIREKIQILDKLDHCIAELKKDINDYKIENNKKIADHEVTMAHIEERVSKSATIITMVGGFIAVVISFFIAYFTKK